MDSSWSSTAMDHDMACPVYKERGIRGTSWTNQNPGRRYVKCPNIVCDDFLWIDPLICTREKQIIPGLLRRINKAESEIEATKVNQRKLWGRELQASKAREEALGLSGCLCGLDWQVVRFKIIVITVLIISIFINHNRSRP